jgi:hypothetical protein
VGVATIESSVRRTDCLSRRRRAVVGCGSLASQSSGVVWVGLKSTRQNSNNRIQKLRVEQDLGALKVRHDNRAHTVWLCRNFCLSSRALPSRHGACFLLQIHVGLDDLASEGSLSLRLRRYSYIELRYSMSVLDESSRVGSREYQYQYFKVSVSRSLLPSVDKHISTYLLRLEAFYRKSPSKHALLIRTQ